MVLAHNIADTTRTQDVQISQNVTFDSMLLATNTLQGLKNSGFYKPSPIQLHGIPLGKCGFDLLLEAKSGTGKTAVFTVICLEKLNLSKGLQAIMLAPTREIAAQICDVITQIGSCYKELNVAVVMGGLPVHEDVKKFKNKNIHIVVGSPGRLRQLIQEKHIDVSAIRLVVLDEADKLLTKSFLPEINYIYSLLPAEKQVIMCSATYTEETKEFIKNYVQNAQHVCPDSTSVLLGIAQKITTVKQHSHIVKQTKLRFEELLKILSKTPFKQCLIFCNYQVRITELHKMLTKEKWPAEQLYGRQEQINRLGALKSLQEYKCRILISTDLAARGIDASNVDLVINFEPPYEWQTYLHRIGRAGRYGSYGTAITILSDGQETKRFIDMIKEIKVPICLVNVWDEKPFLVESSVELKNDENGCKPHVEEKLKKENIKQHYDIEDDYPSLWTLLKSDLKKETDAENNIMSFERLCDDFKKVEIESFSDLLSSLDKYESQTENIIKDKTSKDMSNEKTYSEDGNNKSSKDEVVDNISQVNYKNINMNGVKNEHVCNYIENTSDAESIDSVKEAMINAGLPTAFGSSKLKNQMSNSFRKCKHNTSNRRCYSDKGLDATHSKTHEDSSKYVMPCISEPLPNINQDDFSEESVHHTSSTSSKCSNTPLTQKKQLPRKKGRVVPSDNSDDDYSTEGAPFIANKKKTSYIKNKTKLKPIPYTDDEYDCHYDFFYDYQEKASRSKTYTKSSSNTLKNNSSKKYQTKQSQYKQAHFNGSSQYDNNNYSNWHKSLKTRVKQIELAVYVNELSQLHSQY